MPQGMNKSEMQQRSSVRQAKNVLDYKKIIMDRSVDRDMSKRPKPAMMVYPRKRERIAFANR